MLLWVYYWNFAGYNCGILKRRKPGIFPCADVPPGGILLAARRQGWNYMVLGLIGVRGNEVLERNLIGTLLVVLEEMGTRFSYEKANEWNMMGANNENKFVVVYNMETNLVG